jgi:L-malate glycosyltransferase
MVRIQAAIPGALLLLVGEGSLRPQLERLTMSLAISDAVRFFGIRTDIPLILAASDMFLLASLREGLPLALVEAGAASLPAVATRVDGIREVIDDEVTGLLVPPEDSDQLAIAVITLLKDRERAREMGRRAREHVVDRFDINPAVRKVENLYDEAVRGTRRIFE